MLEFLRGFKTVLFNIIMTVVMAMQLWFPGAEVPTADQVNSAVGGLELFLTLAWGLGNVVLRAVTNTQIFKKE